MAVAILSSTLFAEPENVIIEGSSVAILSSQEHATLVYGERDVDEKTIKRAKKWCAFVGKEYSHMSLHTPTGDEIEEMHKRKTYRARVLDDRRKGFVLQEGIFPLVQPAEPKSIAKQIENKFYVSAAIIFIGGGLATFLIASGFDGEANYFASGLTGSISGTLSGLSALGGLMTRYFFGRPSHKDEVELDDLATGTPIYVLPVLIDELFCK
jgi:hypothetical protein